MRRNLEERYGLFDIGGDNAKFDTFVRDVSATLQENEAMRMSRLNASLGHAEHKYGQDFRDTFQDVTSMDVRNPLARQIVTSVLESGDPGEALMELHGNSLVRGLGQRSPPFYSFTHPRVVERAPQGRGSSGGFDSGWGDRDIEQSIFDAATWND
jgi:hypothetical protein